jgi:hypothetical protein
LGAAHFAFKVAGFDFVALCTKFVYILP